MVVVQLHRLSLRPFKGIAYCVLPHSHSLAYSVHRHGYGLCNEVIVADAPRLVGQFESVRAPCASVNRMRPDERRVKSDGPMSDVPLRHAERV